MNLRNFRRSFAVFNFFFFVSLAGLCLSSWMPAYASSSLQRRCESDPGYPDQARRRVAWALKCGLIAQDFADFMNRQQMYPTFEIPGRSMYLWFDRHAPCYDKVVTFGWCYAVGCFAADTQILFPDGLKTLEQAFQEGLEEIISLDEQQKFSEDINFQRSPINHYLAGPTKEDLIEVSTATKSIKVTQNHPMVMADGGVVSANELIAGLSVVATLDGAELIQSLRTVEYDGEVWNVLVKSDLPGANVHFANGFLTGGFRYQNQWTEHEDRHPGILNKGFVDN